MLCIGHANGSPCLLVLHCNGTPCFALQLVVVSPRKNKLLEAKKRFEDRNGGKSRLADVKDDYSNLEP